MKSSKNKSRTRKSGRRKKEAFFEKEGNKESSHEAFFKKNNVHPKLTIGKADDPFEKEADQMARQVMENQQSSTMLDKGQQVQKQEAEEEEVQAKRQIQKQEEEEEVQAKKIRKQEEEEEAQPKLQKMEEEEEVQAKRKIQKQEEEEEMQAKRKIQKQEEEEEMQAKPIRRKQKGDSTDLNMKLSVQKKSADTASPEIERMLSLSKGKGRPLPEDIRQEMESSFKSDFSQVMIHTGSDAIQMTQELEALAFTHGNDIYFNEGQFQPYSSKGKELLAHELTHVVQQNG